jgi:hypothetical protein
MKWKAEMFTEIKNRKSLVKIEKKNKKITFGHVFEVSESFVCLINDRNGSYSIIDFKDMKSFEEIIGEGGKDGRN